MKKIFYSIFAVAALALTSCAGAGGVNPLDLDASKCDDKTEKCWKYTVSVAGVSEDAYVWGTEKYVVEVLQTAYKGSAAAGVSVSLAETAGDDAESCLEQNL
jgi:hypothetical protein